MARQLAHAEKDAVSLVLLDAFAPDGTAFGLEAELALLAALGNELALRAGLAIEGLTPGELSRLPAPDRIAYLVERALGGRALVAELAGWRPEALVRVALANARALATYRPTPYAGPALLLKASVRREAAGPSPEQGWASLAPNLLTQEVEGDHHGIVRPPHVRGLAEALDRWLDLRPHEPTAAPP
jgi:thioesterase domain-containing protein